MKTTTMTDPVLELVGVSKHYDGFSLRDVTFSLERGYIMGFIGPNGAGKSVCSAWTTSSMSWKSRTGSVLSTTTICITKI
jgi:ABC-type branched-subunit amino acid transport system ATPase component